jgi:superfamily I DNA/RNA helicase
MGSKGLQADHVIIIGVNEGHFPNRNDRITDEEVSQLIVALTRTRKSCTIVSTDRLGGERLRRSRFVEWLNPFLDEIRADKAFFDQMRC